MRRSTITLCVMAATALAACGGGSSGHFANHTAPASPVNVTVYINGRGVSISPSYEGAGPVVFTVTNQAAQAEAVSIFPGQNPAGRPIANTSPINPQATTQFKVDLKEGQYLVGASSTGVAASTTSPTGGSGASLRIGPPRPSSGSDLLQP